MRTQRPPAVSVIIPTFNRAHVVGKAIQSVLEQTFQDHEVIVVDDASTDNTTEVIRGLDDVRIIYITHDRRCGGSAARNTGIRVAQGAYVAFLDSDDEWLPEKLEKQVAALERAPHCGAVYCAFFRVETAGRRLVRNERRDGLRRLLLERGFVITLSTVVARREVLDSVGGFDESLPSYQDTDLFIRLVQATEFEYVPEPLVVQDNTGSDRITANYSARVEGYKDIILKHHGFLGSDPRGLAEYYLELGRLSLKVGDSREARRAFVGAIRAHPTSLRPYFHLAALAAGRSLYGTLQGSYKRLRLRFRGEER